MAHNPVLYESFLVELQKIAATKNSLPFAKARSGRRPLSVSTLLKKDKEGTLFKKHAGLLELLKTPIPGTKDWVVNTGKQGLQGAARVAKKLPQRTVSGTRTIGGVTSIGGDELKRLGFGDLSKVGHLKIAYELQGHTTHQGLPIAIENGKGSVRKGVDKDGKKWRTRFKHPYGYIKNTEGKDGEEIDAYLGPNKHAPNAFVVHQRKLDGRGHDEDKVMFGFDSEADARAAYLEHYNKVGPKLLGPISTITVEELKRRLSEKRKHTKLAMASPYVDRDAQPDPAKRGDVPSRDGTNPGGAGVEKTEDGRGSAATIPTNGALLSSGTGATTRL